MTNPIKKILLPGWLRRQRRNIISFLQFREEFKKFQSLSRSAQQRFPLSWKDRIPCLEDKVGNTPFDRHYIYHTAWASRILAKTKPSYHVDISSSLYFCSILSAFIPIRYYDFRPPELQLDNLSSEPVDLLALPFENKSIKSLSCMHVLEHIGLGRYADQLDPDGDLSAIQELKRVLAAGGDLLLVVPTGQARIMFNAHRIYRYAQIVTYFSGLDLKEFALIPDDPRQGSLIRNATEAMADSQTYGCGCFWFGKRV